MDEESFKSDQKLRGNNSDHGLNRSGNTVNGGGQGPQSHSSASVGSLTMTDIMNDPVTRLAFEYWAAGAKGPKAGTFDAGLVIEVFNAHISKSRDTSKLTLLDYSGYLENYLWPNFDASTASFEHVFSIIAMINFKCSERLDIIATLAKDEGRFVSYFNKVVDTRDFIKELHFECIYIKFLIYVFQSLETPSIARCCLKYVFIPIWSHISSERLAVELQSHAQLKKKWQELVAAATGSNNDATSLPTSKRSKLATSTPSVDFGKEGNWMPSLIIGLMQRIESFDSSNPPAMISVFEVFLELLIDLLSQVRTRRFLNTLIIDLNLVVRCRMSYLVTSGVPHGSLFTRLLQTVDTYIHFPINDHSGKALTAQQVLNAYTIRMQKLQKIAFDRYRDDLKDLIFSSLGTLNKPDALRKHFLGLNSTQIFDIARSLGVLSVEDTKLSIINKSSSVIEVDESSHSYIVESLLNFLIPKKTQVEEIANLPLYSTEETLWNPDFIPMASLYMSHNTNNNKVLALPKLNLHFLTMYDYLLRNFSLYRLESSDQIREDLVEAIKQMGPVTTAKSKTAYTGWSRYAVTLRQMNIEEIAKPSLGKDVPRSVRCNITVDLSAFTGKVRDEWEAIREHDVLFLVCIENPSPDAAKDAAEFEGERQAWSRGEKPRKRKDFQKKEEGLDFPQRYGIKYVRGAEVFEIRDEDDVILNNNTIPDTRPKGRKGSSRKIRLNLDPSQYYNDLKNGNDCYNSFNLVVRRDQKENNFKSVLSTIKELIAIESIGQGVPAWLSDILLGFGDPSAANYRSLLKKVSSVQEKQKYMDTFLSASHLIESFPNASSISFPEVGVVLTEADMKSLSESVASRLPPPPYRIEIAIARIGSIGDALTVYSCTEPNNRGPYPLVKSVKNNVRFTPAQVEAIRSGMNPGLTLVVGPPGTGKTDTAVQIICNLYHNFPTQKIVLVAHSNAALNDLFEKIMERDIDPRHLLRLGSGEHDLRDNRDDGQGEIFSKQGRVNWSLSKRLELLAKVQRLGQSLGALGDVGATCETAEYFYSEKVKCRLEKFEIDFNSKNESVSSLFPFQGFFIDAPQPLFPGLDRQNDYEIAMSCFRYIQGIFDELQEYRALELLRTQAHRTDYILTKQARIVAMTCTHASIIRSKLIELDFKYDSLIMEESAQILEIESFVPMLLQSHSSVEDCRLKRVILIGDHYQLPPVVQHQAFKTFSNLEQSMFKRFVRLSVPRVLLDRQGRCRPELASLFNWRYSSNGISLQNLPVIHQNPRYLLANPGFLYTYQFINVPDFEGKGERAPSPHFYQNVGEAEYVVALYQFMRLIGYPAEKISILATYNGQKQLIQDIIAKRCRNPIFGRPASVTTVDKYQGQQNDFILLSLVRTESVGHIRDIRRLIVALSRARLGLYIFGRRSLYQNCFEISNALSYVLNGPAELSLVRDENYSAVHRPLSSHVAPELIVPIADVTALGVLVYQMTQNYQLFQQQQSSLQLQQTDALQTLGANPNTIKSSMDIDENDSV